MDIFLLVSCVEHDALNGLAPLVFYKTDFEQITVPSRRHLGLSFGDQPTSCFPVYACEAERSRTSDVGAAAVEAGAMRSLWNVANHPPFHQAQDLGSLPTTQGEVIQIQILHQPKQRKPLARA
jgi:hypothetical protein